MYNKVILVGNLTRDVEIRYTSNGSAIAKVGIAVNRKFKAQNGEQKEEVLFIDLTFFGKTAEIANQYLKRGSKVLIEGRLILEQWTNQQGQKQSKHSIVVESMQMLDTKADAQNNQYGNSNGTTSNTQQEYRQPPAQKEPTQPTVPEVDIDDDEIPF
jgi:single-strand DNA-binding protein